MHGLPPPALMALLGQARHRRLAPTPLTKVVLAPHVQVRASAPLTPPVGQETHVPPATTLYVPGEQGWKHCFAEPEPDVVEKPEGQRHWKAAPAPVAMKFGLH